MGEPHPHPPARGPGDGPPRPAGPDDGGDHGRDEGRGAPADAVRLRVERLHCRLGGREILHGISFSVRAGEVVGILGPNGCGKSTLLRCLAGLCAPSAGGVAIDGLGLGTIPPAALARRLALQGQDATGALGFTVRDIVAMGRLPHRPSMLAGAGAADDAVVTDSIRRLGLDDLADRSIETLSGGERQRVTIARAVAQQPDILLLDEPTNHLDVRHRFAVLGLVRRLGITVVAVLHEIDLAARWCDRVLLMADGRVVADGPPAAVLTAERLQEVYAVAARVTADPHTGRLRIELEPLQG
ncbi:iron complex transport system ATP-binding protein [Rhodoplanes tepidamans]|uniref:ABC transporter ATP-binding protein n=1 Tax=Rhodoplanes tepidamans TaxID=200616 RepID=A0ABT5JBQ7_RHOTP|nr:ABC transporter ATP-binding protein [Rhodoplanes tepidamans]MDC7787104.1 ABC transporter ATP-binding protein [Rhodoplanes tepidamans]MDQ0358704.1 iron complex transport system ATP-binding protein [Rhodoplanes tepidamans]